MAAQQNSELIELKNFISDRFNQLDQKIDRVQAELRQEIAQGHAELKQDITQVKSELKQDISDLKGDIKALHAEVKGIDKRLSLVENSVAKIPEITEKFGELKNWRQTAFVIIAGVVSAFLGWIARGNRIWIALWENAIAASIYLLKAVGDNEIAPSKKLTIEKSREALRSVV